MEQSILTSTKKILGVSPDDTSFDMDICTHINSALAHLHDIGIGPTNAFFIEDDVPEWADLAEEHNETLSLVKTCIYLRVRMLFDPPATSYLVTAFEKQIAEHEFRLSVQRENREWFLPVPVLPDIIEGGDAG